jgi:hypothetical protein
MANDGQVKNPDVSDAEIAAMEILTEDNVPLETIARYTIGWRIGGKDPISSAHHIVNLRKALRDG